MGCILPEKNGGNKVRTGVKEIDSWVKGQQRQYSGKLAGQLF